MLHLNAFSVLGVVSDDVRKSRVCTMFVNRLRASDNRDNSASLWFTGLLAGASVASVYYLYRSRRNAPYSQQAAHRYPSPSVSGDRRDQFLVVVDGATASTLKVCKVLRTFRSEFQCLLWLYGTGARLCTLRFQCGGCVGGDSRKP